MNIAGTTGVATINPGILLPNHFATAVERNVAEFNRRRSNVACPIQEAPSCRNCPCSLRQPTAAAAS